MRLAVSNIAWPAASADAAYDILAEAGVDGLEVAPGLLFAGDADPFVPAEASCAALLRRLDAAGLTLCSMQSLLFGVSEAALFGTAEERAALDKGLARAIALAGRLGIPNLVFGSPKNRVIPDGISRATAFEMAAESFHRLGDLAADAACRLALEPNPAAYGTNFLTTVDETDAFVRFVDHPAVTINFDVGAMHLNGTFSDISEAFRKAAPRVSHVHLSEPNLAPFPRDAATAGAVFGALRAAGWNGWVSIEMRAEPEEPLAALRRSVMQTADAMREA